MGFSRIDKLQPAISIRASSVDEIEERRLDRLGDRAAFAVADRDLVDGTDRRDFDGRSGEKRLIRDVEELSRQHLLADLDAQVLRHGDDGISCNSGQN